MIIRFSDGDTLDFLNEFSVEHEHHGMNLPEVGDIVSLKTKEAEIAESNSDEIYLAMCYVVKRKVMSFEKQYEDDDSATISISYVVKKEPPPERTQEENDRIKEIIIRKLAGNIK